eukprot:GHRQ01015323.1.p1 GENE.GHRQ01015323.1~~GHRQ01015323.1.p1  ORF type:complete len:253 (+),score=68.03 GHRQ01015323.1:33-761(+)
MSLLTAWCTAQHCLFTPLYSLCSTVILLHWLTALCRRYRLSGAAYTSSMQASILLQHLAWHVIHLQPLVITRALPLPAPAGVMVGRAALGRPWLFTEAAAMLSGRWPARPPPELGGVLQAALRHVTAWADWEQDERGAVLKMRKLIPCYLQGFSTARRLQGQLFAATSLADWQALVTAPEAWGFDPAEPYPLQALRRARLKGAGQIRGGAKQKVALPPGWLEEGSDDEEGVPECLYDAACEG